MSEVSEEIRAGRLRRKAAKFGLRLIKSHARNPDRLDFGLYGLVIIDINGMVNPHTVDNHPCSWSLDDVESYLSEEQAKAA